MMEITVELVKTSSIDNFPQWQELEIYPVEKAEMITGHFI